MKDEDKTYPFIPYKGEIVSPEKTSLGAKQFLESIKKRRSVRDFSSRSVPKEVVAQIVEAAATAPSGAHKQPISFCVISNPALKKQIRIAAEKEEYLNYNGRMPEAWIQDLAPLGTDWEKPFLEIAPWLVIMFKKSYELKDGKKAKNYYVNESAGIAAGFLIAAIHNAGLVTLTHTPSPMDFLHKILDRPANEKAYLLLPIGYPADQAKVPDIQRKPFDQMVKFYE